MSKKILLALMLAVLATGGTFSVSHAQNMSVSELIDLFIKVGIIPADKADAARSAVSGSGNAKACYTFAKDMSIGSSGSDVKELQKSLGIATTGTYDEDTAEAVVEFQSNNGIRKTGYAGPLTRAKLNTLCGGKGSAPAKPVTSIPPTSISVPGTTIQPPTTASSIVVTRPLAGDVWRSGTVAAIAWKDSAAYPACPDGAECMIPAPKRYDLTLIGTESCSTSTNGSTLCTTGFAVHTVATGVYGSEYSYKVPSTAAGSYRVQVCRSGTSDCGTSAFFKVGGSEQDTNMGSGSGVSADTGSGMSTGGQINASNFTVVSPNGGESAVEGSNLYIKWSLGASTPISDSDTVKIALLDAGGAERFVIASGVSAAKGSYSWRVSGPADGVQGQVASLAGAYYRVKVSLSSGAGSDISDKPFYINPAKIIY